MKNSDNACFICGNKEFSFFNNYKRCKKCLNETIIGVECQTYIVNDILDKKILKKDFLFLFKKNVVLKSASNFSFLVDIGSGSGQFLYFIKEYFLKASGIEITEDCYKFSREVLNLDIHKSIDEIDGNFSVATFWHSLEHIPIMEIDKLISYLKRLSTKDSKIIISVPNSDSIQYYLFGKDYAYYDYPNHLHQFSYKSLCLLLDKYDFEIYKDFNSFYYILFGYIQSFLNKFNKIHNYFYYRKKRGFEFNLSKVRKTILDIYNYFLISVFFIPSLLLTFFEYFTKEKRGVITLCFQKKLH